MGDDYGYFGSGSSGYAHYQQTFKSCFGGSGGSGGGHHNNDPDWSSLLTLLKIGVLVVVPIYCHPQDVAKRQAANLMQDLLNNQNPCYVAFMKNKNRKAKKAG